IYTPSLFFFSAPATSAIYTLSLHDALPISVAIQGFLSSVLDLTQSANVEAVGSSYQELTGAWRWVPGQTGEPPTHLLGRLCHTRSEEHTSELQSLAYLVCRLLLEKKK